MGGWIGVDLDGTLAKDLQDVMTIGPPVPRMIDRVIAWIAAGEDVRIFTARVGPATAEECALAFGRSCDPDDWIRYQTALIQHWCLTHLGISLPVTCQKDFQMGEFWDDRCKQVIPNLGESIEENYRGSVQLLEQTEHLMQEIVQMAQKLMQERLA